MIQASEIRAICYADVFDYPLTRKELLALQIEGKSQFDLRLINKSIQQKKGFFFLLGHEKIVELRLQREQVAQQKFEVAKKVASFLRFIPTIEFIAVTGGLAMNNSDESDDIDFFIVSSSGTLWTTRFLSVCFLEIMGMRRRPKNSKQKNKICLNMFVDSDHMAVPQKERDVFSAHEVVQAKILFGKNESIRKFYKQNLWITDFLPHMAIPKFKNTHEKSSRMREIMNIFVPILHSFEFIFRKLQLWYMKNKRTNEIVTDGYTRFHPNDARNWILKKYQDRLGKVGIR